MDSKIKFKVLNSYIFSNFGLIVKLENVEIGIPKNAVLKCLNSNLFWEAKNRIIEHSSEESFEFEEVLKIHINHSEYMRFSEILKVRNERNIRLYKLESIGNQEKPEIGESLVFHATTFRNKMQIKAIAENYFLLENKEGYKAVIPKRKVLKSDIAKIGDYVRHCEHHFHDLVDENDNFVNRL